MAYDEGQAQILRDALADHPDITEKKMFGGLCFMKAGHMLCGVHERGGMIRVGKDNQKDALALPGLSPLSFTGRPMGGILDMSEDVLADQARLEYVLELALQFVSTLKPK